jgi:hypothetical protein
MGSLPSLRSPPFFMSCALSSKLVGGYGITAVIPAGGLRNQTKPAELALASFFYELRTFKQA